jgi:hypothetical protein
MPPPGFPSNGFDYMPQTPNYGGYDSRSGSNGGFTGTQDQDWLALPLDSLLNQWGADVTQTALGPDVGGMDMLDILLNMGAPPGSN